MFALVYGLNDPAGKGIADFLIDYYRLDRSDVCGEADTCFVGGNFYLAGFNREIIYLDYLDEKLPSNIERIIVLSRHSSAKKVKSYTVHHTGNFGPEALYGGKPRSLSVASPLVSHKLLLLLKKHAESRGRISEYEVSYEATHHGPTEVNKPLNFIEIGSTLDEWRDKINHEVIGLTIAEFLEDPGHQCRVVAGIGGGHYPRKHTRLAFEKNYCYGHIMAKYALQYLSPETLLLMVKRSDPEPEAFIVEKKGTRREHRVLIEEFVKERSFDLEYV